MFPLYYSAAFSPSLIASFDRLLCKNGLHHCVLRAIIRWFVDRRIYGNDNEEWCGLSTYKIGLTFTILSQEAHFFFIQ